MSLKVKYLGSVLLFSSLATTSSWGADYPITTEADLIGAIDAINASPGSTNTITLNNSIVLSKNLKAFVSSGSSTTIQSNGGPFFIDGFGLYQPVFVYRSNVTIDNVTLQNSKAQGGTGGTGAGGGGGGAGMGGGLFVKGGNTVTVSNVVFSSNNAQGGKGGDGNGSPEAGGGGGGIFGNGGTLATGSAGGGGGGLYGNAGIPGGRGGTGGGGFFFNGGDCINSGGGAGAGGGGFDGPGINATSDNGANGGTNGGAGGGGKGGDLPAVGLGGSGGLGSPPGSNGSPGTNSAGINAGDGGAGGDGGAFGGGGGGGVGGNSPGAGTFVGNGGKGGNGYPAGGNGFSDGGGGGGGGRDGQSVSVTGKSAGAGGAGGFGSGGGGGGFANGATSGAGGAGGFGGGGAGGSNANGAGSIGGAGGAGGFGGGGGGNGGGGGTNGGPGAGGTFGGAGGGIPGRSGGGGGAGLGGAIFLENDSFSGAATLNINDGCSFSGNTTTIGAGGAGSPLIQPGSPGSPGLAFGNDIFMMAGTTINFNLNSSLTIPSPIESDNDVATGGGLFKTGTGTLTLQGIPSTSGYTGGTFFNGGVVSVAANATLGRDGLFFDGGTLQWTGNTSSNRAITLNSGGGTMEVLSALVTVTGNMTGAGSFTKSGAGTLSLQSGGANTYSGGTTISAGTLQIMNTASLPSGGNMDLSGSSAVLNLSPAAGSFTLGDLSGVAGSTITLGTSNLTFGTANSTTFGGSINGLGNVAKQGSGIVTFSGASTYTGPTSINAGTFVLNGSITSPTTVAAGATLKGIGTIFSSLNVFGTLQPGNSVGTMTVAGPVSFNTGSTFVAEVSPSQASLLNVTAGGVTISSDVTLSILVDPGTYTLGSVYTIIQTTGGVTGKFSPVIDNAPLFDFTVIYPTNFVQLILNKKANAFTSLVSSGNAGAVAECLDQANPAPGTDFNFVFNQLLFVPNAKVLKHALNQMQPSQYNALHLTQENTNTRVLSVLSDRAAQIHRACKPSEETWGVWFDAFGDGLNQKNQNGQYGFHAATGAALAGFDGHASPHLHLGLGGAYTWTHMKWAGGHGNSHIKSGYGFAYGTYHVRHFFLDAEFMGGSNNYKANRHIGFLAIDRHAKSNHHGYTLAGRLTGGFPLHAGRAEIAPLLSLDYDYVHQKAFKENGAQSLNLRIHQKNANLLRAEAGFRVTRRCPLELMVDPCTGNEICGSDVRFLPSFQLTVIREWRFQGERYRSRLQDLNCTFTTKGLNPDRTLISPAVGLTWLLHGDRVALTLDYTGEFAFDGNFWDQKGNLQLSYAF